MKDDITSTLRKTYSESITVKSILSFKDGGINQTQVLLLSNGERVLLKSNSHPPKNFFECEARGLKILAQANAGFKVPEIMGFDPSPHPHFIILEYVEEASSSKEYFEQFGQMLATLHQNTQDNYGLDHDNFIGKIQQKNTLEKDGLHFFTEHRIGFQQELARETGKLPSKLDKRLDKLRGQLGSILNLDSERPALLHGDLWSGNHFPASVQVPCIFDPAVYYGPREADLAMTELFGAMPQTFYSAYREAFPLDPGYHERSKIYNLYHLLNHLNLFGGSYLSSVEAAINEFIL